MDEPLEVPGPGLQIRLDRPSAGAGLISMMAADGTTEFAPNADESPGLWSLEFRTPLRDGERETATVRCSDGVPQVESLTDAIKLEWSGLDLPGEAEVIDVTVTIQREGDGAGAVWTIELENRSARFGLWHTVFPEFRGFLEPGEFDVARPASNVGKLLRGLSEKTEGLCASMTWPIQAFSVERDGKGLLICSLDRVALQKRFLIDPGNVVSIATPAQCMGEPGSGSGQSLSFLTAPVSGWLQAAKRYRRVAESMPWLGKGPIHARHDVPPKAIAIGVWLQLEGPPDAASETALGAMRAMGQPAVFHWYNPWQIPYDTYYPNFLPPKPRFAAACQRVRDAGGELMPHMNGRLWDVGMDSWEKEARPNAVIGADLEPSLEYYEISSKRDVGAMCPATQMWQERIQSIAKELFADYGVRALYIDQIAAASPALCFGESHGHEPGNGAYWVDGYHSMLREIRASAGEGPERSIITSEGTAEPYIDIFDSLLNWAPATGDDIPFGPAIYSGYVSYYGSPCPFDKGLETIVVNCGRAFLWGVKVGWIPARHVANPDFSTGAAYLGELGRLHFVHNRFLVLGEFLGEPIIDGRGEPVSAHSAVEVDAFQGRMDEPDFEVPAVMGSVWRAPDGDAAVFLANLSLDDRSVNWQLSNESVDLHGRRVFEVADDGAVAADPQDLPLHVSLAPAQIKAYLLK